MKKKNSKEKTALFSTDEKSEEKPSTLGQRRPPEEIMCPECGGKAERQRNGDWRCVASEKINELPPISQLTCAARGTTLAGDDRVTLQGSIYQL